MIRVYGTYCQLMRTISKCSCIQGSGRLSVVKVVWSNNFSPYVLPVNEDLHANLESEGVAVHMTAEPLNTAPSATLVVIVLPGEVGGGVIPEGVPQTSFVYAELPALLKAFTR